MRQTILLIHYILCSLISAYAVTAEDFLYLQRIYTEQYLPNRINDYSLYCNRSSILDAVIDTDLDMYLLRQNIPITPDESRQIELYVAAKSAREMGLYEKAITLLDKIKGSNQDARKRFFLTQIKIEKVIMSSYLGAHDMKHESESPNVCLSIYNFAAIPTVYLLEQKGKTFASECFILFKQFHQKSENLREVHEKIDAIENQNRRRMCQYLFYLHYGIGHKPTESEIMEMAVSVNEKDTCFILSDLLESHYNRIQSFSNWLTAMVLYLQADGLGRGVSKYLFQLHIGVKLSDENDRKLRDILNEIWQQKREQVEQNKMQNSLETSARFARNTTQNAVHKTMDMLSK